MKRVVKQNVTHSRCSVLVIQAQPYSVDCYVNQPCQPCIEPPCPQKKKSYKSLIFALKTLAVVGAALTYAKYSKPVRSWLDDNWPWASSLVGAVFQEEKTYGQQLNEKWNALSKAVEGFLFGHEGVMPINIPYRSEQNLEEEAKKAFAPRNYQLPCLVLTPLYLPPPNIKAPDIDDATIVLTEKCEPRKPQKVDLKLEQVEVEQEMYRCTAMAVDGYREAVKLCQKFQTILNRVIQAPMEAIDQKDMDALKPVKMERDNAKLKATELSACAKCGIETLSRLQRMNKIAAPDQELAILQRYCKQFMDDITKAERAYIDCAEKTIIPYAYWDKVRSARAEYCEELKSMFPDVNFNEKEPIKITQTNKLINYFDQQIQLSQRQIAELQTVKEVELNRAIECKNKKVLLDEKVQSLVQKEAVEGNEKFSKKRVHIEQGAERKLRQAMDQQYKAHQQKLEKDIESMKKKKFSQLNKVINEKLTGDRLAHKQKLAQIKGKLKALEDGIKKRETQSVENKKALEVWTAAEALLAATRRPEPETVVKNEIQALENVGKNHKMVSNVVKTIKPEVKDGKKKIVTEKALYDNFDRVESNAKSVALIGPEGASLPAYFFSWVCGKLISPIERIPNEELHNKKKIDFTKFDTFDIMHRARHHIENGNLPTAVKYMNLLSGAPRAAAKRWIDDARTHLEVKQAAEVVMADAALADVPEEKPKEKAKPKGKEKAPPKGKEKEKGKKKEK